MFATVRDQAETYRGILADHLDETARWREDKPEQFPEDARNARSAAALTAAAEYLRSIEDPVGNLAVRRYAEFDDELSSWTSVDPVGLIDPGEVAGRFFFDNGQRQPTPHDFDALLLRVFDETLRSWREHIQDGIDQPPRSLVEFFRDNGVPLWEDEADDA